MMIPIADMNSEIGNLERENQDQISQIEFVAYLVSIVFGFVMISWLNTVQKN
ncbi:MAG: hypothetical protein ACOYK9_05800 [Chlamydiia bacterium]